MLLEEGQFRNIYKSDKKVIHVGHSFDCVITYNLTNIHPEASTGIVLTGFSQVPDFIGLFTLGGNFVSVSRILNLRKKYPKG